MSTAQDLIPDELEDRALHLRPAIRAELVASLTGPDQDLQREWLAEAERRRRELIEGRVLGIPAEGAFAEARSRLP